MKRLGSRRRFIAQGAAGATTLAAPWVARGKPKMELKIATLAPEGSTWMKAFHSFRQQVEERTEGEVRFRFYAGGVLGDESAMIRKMRTGQLDGAAVTALGLSHIDEQVLMLGLPLVFSNYRQVDHVRAEMTPDFEAMFEKQGFKLGGWGDIGFIYVFSNTPIREPSDVSKAKFWVWAAAPGIEKTAEITGFNGVPLDLADVLPGLQTGLIDAFANSPYGAIALQWYTKARFVTNLRLAMGVGASVVSLKTWEKLSDDVREVLEDVTKFTQRKLQRAIRHSNQRAVGTLQRKGIEVVEPQNMVEWGNVSMKVRNALVPSMFDAELVDRMLRLVEEA